MGTKLRSGWYSFKPGDCDPLRPGVYEWRIEGAGVYIGKAKKLRGRIGNYPNNVRRMIDGLPWHGDSARDYRRVHRELRQAYAEGRAVQVFILENCDATIRAEREQWWIIKRREEALQNGPPVLNQT